MSRRTVSTFAICAALLLACRAVVGIEDLHLEADAGSDASADVATAPDAHAEQIAECLVAAECRKCCKDNFIDFQRLENNEQTRACFCSDAGGKCTSQCSDSYCGSGTPTQPSMTCAPCLDDQFALPQSPCARGCDSAECLAGLSCMQACQLR